MITTDDDQLHRAFLASSRPELLMVTNHGIHQWQVTPGLPDTGGQNVFVNQMSAALDALGFRVTIANRGGYPHPRTGEPREGLRYRGPHQRILYLEDGLARFVPKEEMAGQIPRLAEHLARHLADEQASPLALISHYWDAAALAARVNRALPRPLPHLWIPHSLGTVKRRNTAPALHAAIRVEERIAAERALLAEGAVDRSVATSAVIRQALAEDYDARDPLFLPPCVDPERYRPREVDAADPLWAMLAHSAPGLSAEQIRDRRLVTEISRTDRTKRKDLLIEAFARVHPRFTDALLVIAIDEREGALAGELLELVQQRGIAQAVITVGSIWDHLPSLYAASAIYCTPSVMEGFGMSIQEAAACGVPAVSSDLVPFAVEYLAGDAPRQLPGGLLQGAGALIAPADDVAVFAAALERLLADEPLRRQLGEAAHAITIPAFTWPARTREFLRQAGLVAEEAR